MQHIRQVIITHKSRKMGTNSIKYVAQDIKQDRKCMCAKHFWHICLTIPMKNGNMVTLVTNVMIPKKINDKTSANLARMVNCG